MEWEVRSKVQCACERQAKALPVNADVPRHCHNVSDVLLFLF